MTDAQWHDMQVEQRRNAREAEIADEKVRNAQRDVDIARMKCELAGLNRDCR
jgi:hypothetical protein